MNLTAEELVELTGKTRPSAQLRVLEFLHIPARRRPDGSLIVLRADVIETQDVRAARSAPRLRLDA